MNVYTVYLLIVFFSIQSVNAFEIQSSASASLGGAGTGSVNAVDGGYLNPSAIALFERNALSLNLANNGYRIYFADNGRDSMFPAAIAYTQLDLNGQNAKSFHLMFAKAIQDQFAFGANIHYRELKIDAIDKMTSQSLIDVSAIFKNFDFLSLGFVFKNKPLSRIDLDDYYGNNPSLVFGIEYNYIQLLYLKLDIENTQNSRSEQKQIYKVGVESRLNDWFMLRMGYQNNNVLEQNYSTFGFGFGTADYGLHYAYVKESNFKKDSNHSVDLTVPF